jgi:hypothetical protein
MKIILAFTAIVISLLTGCATPPPAEWHSYQEAVSFDGFNFKIDEVRILDKLPDGLPQAANNDSGVKWASIHIRMTNITQSPIQFQFHPSFKLISSSGASYEEDTMLGAIANTKTGYNVLTPLNPFVGVSRILVFEIPTGKYSLEVNVPYATSTTLLSVTSYNRRFFFELPDIQ